MDIIQHSPIRNRRVNRFLLGKEQKMTREEAIEVMKAYRDKVINSVSNQLDGDIKAFDMAIQALSQEPCNDAIDREYLFKVLDDFCGHDRTATITLDTLADLVYELPSVTQKSGKWHIAHGWYEDRFWCSCGYIRIMDSRMNEWKYCPVCGGAKMESEVV